MPDWFLLVFSYLYHCYHLSMKMNKEELRIVLSHIEEEEVHLDNLSSEALDSFLTVMSSLKNIAEDMGDTDITFSIEKGSAAFALYGSPQNITTLSFRINEAIEGKSSNSVITDNMRGIQNQIKNPIFKYSIFCDKKDIAPKIKLAKRITKLRVAKKFDYKLEVITGFFNQIGGNDPNYHLDRGAKKDKLTIECTIENAKELKEQLYEETSVVAITKKDKIHEGRPIYTHCAKLQSQDQINRFKIFAKEYNELSNLMLRLEYLYDFVYDSNIPEDDITILLKIFRNKNFDINEIKTMLVISKNIKNEELQLEREKLLSLFNELRS